MLTHTLIGGALVVCAVFTWVAYEVAGEKAYRRRLYHNAAGKHPWPDRVVGAACFAASVVLAYYAGRP